MKSRLATWSVAVGMMMMGMCASIATACPLAANVSVQTFVPTVAVAPLFATTTTAVSLPLAVNIRQDSCFVGRQARRLSVLPSTVSLSLRAVNRRPIRAFVRPARTRVRVLVR